ncbi:hypothetical protein M0R45_035006 [Rubus argutus]|uniref:Uncharacterized protein n=1 Tax=Rubus argutus TaxID=59490 RepID=A0AAW1VRW8_RUBAR
MEEQTDQKWHEPVLVLDQWCIYRIPSKLRNVNEASFTPQLLSIGPFHHGNPSLRDMDSHKKIYYEKFCERSSKNKDELKTFIQQRQENILRCYAGTIECGNIDFVDIILVDACFIIELFMTNSETENHENYYILRSPWLRKAVQQDLILFENQLPYYLLQDLYDFAKPAFSSRDGLNGVRAEEQAHGDIANGQKYCFPNCFSGPRVSTETNIVIEAPHVQHHFLDLTCEFFKEFTKGKPIKEGVKPKHFTDLVRHFLCTDKVADGSCISTETKNKYNVRKLKAAGVKFIPLREPFVIIKEEKVHKSNFKLACFTAMDLKLTRFWATYEAECVMRNVMALEQLMYPDRAYICSYFLLMDQLVHTVEDVDLLIKDGVIVNLLGSNKAVEKLVTSLCVQIMEDKSCYSKICTQLNEHYEISYWNRKLATLKRVYFKDLWTGSSTVVGFVVFVFSIIGTIQSLS